MKKKKVVPKKNYFYLVVMILIVVILTLCICGIVEKTNNKKLESSYLKGYINEISLNELNNVLSEPSSDLFILITKVNDENTYKFEKDLKKIINKYDLRDNFIYITYDNNLDEINSRFDSDLTKVPAIIYIKNGEYIKGIDGVNSILSSGEFQQLLDEYEVE